MFTNNFKLDGIEEILTDIGYLEEMKGAGEDQEHKYTKKSGKKSKDYDGDGDVEDETDEYAGVKDRAIKKATGKCSKCGKEPCECDDVKEGCGPTHGKKKKMVEKVEQIDEVSADLALKASKAADIKRGKLSVAGDQAGAAAKAAQAKRLYDKNVEKRLGAKSNAAEEFAVEGKNKEGKEQGADGKACWKGYKYAGTENGKDKCVPSEEYMELYLDMIEEGYTIEQVREVIAAYEDGYEVIFEEDGVTINDTQEVLEEEFLSDVEMVADWLYAEGIIEDEDQFFELMEDLSEEEIEELYDVVAEATAMAKRGYDETKLRQRAGGGEAADRATALEKKPTYGDANKTQQRQRYARAQRGDFRKTASSNPGLHVGGHKSNDPKVKAKQAARGAQRGALTPKERKDLNMGYEMIGNSLEEGGLEVRNYSWKEVMESQYARNNPEKYEAEQKKKTPKGAMPPRGDKRREDFERWYAANVR